MSDDAKNPVRIEIMKGGPFLVYGVEDMVDHEGHPVETKQPMALCRCGQSGNKPFCDGTHKEVDFDG